MRQRSRGRECALQILYQIDIRHGQAAQVAETFWQQHEAPADVRAFAEQLSQGVVEHLGEIDPVIRKHASNWDIERMAVIDRNILRLGVFELLHGNEVPPKVCLNEAVELAKRFGDADSSKFINGVLDAIHKARAVA